MTGNSFQTMGMGRATASGRGTGTRTGTGTAMGTAMGTATARATGNRQHTSPNSPSPKRNSRMDKDRYIAALELEVDALKERCMVLDTLTQAALESVICAG